MSNLSIFILKIMQNNFHETAWLKVRQGATEKNLDAIIFSNFEALFARQVYKRLILIINWKKNPELENRDTKKLCKAPLICH